MLQNNIRTIEGKEEFLDLNNPNDLRYLMGKNFVQFLLDRGSDLPYMKLVLNNPNDLRYFDPDTGEMIKL